MSTKEIYISIILTPFHLQQLKLILDQYYHNYKKSTVLIFYTDTLNKTTITSIFNNHNTLRLVNINHLKFQKIKLMKGSIFKNIKNFKQLLNKIDTEIKNINIKKNNRIKIFVGNENDLFSQQLIFHYNKSKNTEIIGFDEGVGHYKREKLKNKLINIVLPLITRFLFSKKILIYRVLGNAQFFKNVYLRFPEYKESKNNNINYIKINTKIKNNDNEKIKKGKVIIYTAPLIEDLNFSKKKYMQFLEKLIYKFTLNNKTVYIKPHPRESTNKYTYLNTFLIDNKIIGEQINYFNYESVVIFNSSLIINLIEIGYPFKRIINVTLSKKNQLLFFNRCNNILLDIKSIDKLTI